MEDAPSSGEEGWDRTARLLLTYLHHAYLDMEMRPPCVQDEVDEESCSAELAIYPPMTNTVPDAPPVGPDQMLVYKTSKQSGTRWLVIQRDDDLLTPEATRQRWHEIQAAMLKELRTWAGLK